MQLETMWNGSSFSRRVPSAGHLLRALLCMPQELIWTVRLPLKFASPQDLGSGTCPQWLVIDIYKASLLYFNTGFHFFFSFWQHFLLLGLLPCTQNCHCNQESDSWNCGLLALFILLLWLSSELFRRHRLKENPSPCQGIYAQQKQMSSSVISSQVSLIYYWGNIKSDECCKN